MFLQVENICSAKVTILLHRCDIQVIEKYFSFLVVLEEKWVIP